VSVYSLCHHFKGPYFCRSLVHFVCMCFYTVFATIHHSWLLAMPPPPQVHNKDVIVVKPHPHHTLLTSFGEETAETKEEMDNTHMWCEVQGHCLVSLVLVRHCHHSCSFRAFVKYPLRLICVRTCIQVQLNQALIPCRHQILLPSITGNSNQQLTKSLNRHKSMNITN